MSSAGGPAGPPPLRRKLSLPEYLQLQKQQNRSRRSLPSHLKLPSSSSLAGPPAARSATVPHPVRRRLPRRVPSTIQEEEEPTRQNNRHPNNNQGALRTTSTSSAERIPRSERRTKKNSAMHETRPLSSRKLPESLALPADPPPPRSTISNARESLLLGRSRTAPLVPHHHPHQQKLTELLEVSSRNLQESSRQLQWASPEPPSDPPPSLGSSRRNSSPMNSVVEAGRSLGRSLTAPVQQLQPGHPRRRASQDGQTCDPTSLFSSLQKRWMDPAPTGSLTHNNQHYNSHAPPLSPRSVTATTAKPTTTTTTIQTQFEILQYTPHDVLSILQEDDAFHTLQASLKQRQCVTNAYVQMTLQFYIRHVKAVRHARREQQQQQQQRENVRPEEPPPPTPKNGLLKRSSTGSTHLSLSLQRVHLQDTKETVSRDEDGNDDGDDDDVTHNTQSATKKETPPTTSRFTEKESSNDDEDDDDDDDPVVVVSKGETPSSPLSPQQEEEASSEGTGDDDMTPLATNIETRTGGGSEEVTPTPLPLRTVLLNETPLPPPLCSWQPEETLPQGNDDNETLPPPPPAAAATLKTKKPTVIIDC